MGCWNKTCMISGLHIRAGQPVAVFMLGQRKVHFDSFCYSNSYFDACLLPFYGEYNDYGAVEKCHGVGMNYIVEALRENLVEMEQGSNPYHDPPAKKDTFNIDKLFELDHEGRLLVKDHYSEERYLKAFLEMSRANLTPDQIKSLEYKIKNMGVEDLGQHVTHVQIHADVFNYIIDNFKVEESYRNRKNEYARREYGFAEILADLPAYIDKVYEKIAEAKEMQKADPKDVKYAVWMLRQEMSELFPYDTTNRAARFLRFESSSESSSRFLINFRDLIMTAAAKETPEKFKELLIDMLKGQWISVFMSWSRKAWFKPIGEGSQNDEHRGHRTLIGAIQSVLDKEDLERDALQREEDEWEKEYEAKERAKKDKKNAAARARRAAKKIAAAQ